MKKRFIPALTAFIILSGQIKADEGMWLPCLISQRFEDMREKGFKLTAEDIYSINQASLKDAVVLFGSGCTGEMVSPEGLLFTNHHCGYWHVARHSSVDHDYLKDGFWALSRSEELLCPGLTVSFLESMEDVTSLVLKNCKENTGSENYAKLVEKRSKRLEEEAVAGRKGYKAKVEALYYSNKYYLFVYKVFTDVRLVGAPPSSIGKFGGDTDNWMWPRHTGDFSIFRVYADENNNPADYSETNVPYKPKKFFKLDTRGIHEGDFTFIYGYPGRTKEYVTSDEVRQIMEITDPTVIALRTSRLGIQKKHMASSPAIRIMYASRNASVANAWKKMQGEVLGLERLKTISEKEKFEKSFSIWAEGGEFEKVLPRLRALYKEYEPYCRASIVYKESAATIELTKFAAKYVAETDMEKRKGMYSEFLGGWYQPIDKECFVAVMQEFDRRLEAGWKPDYFKTGLREYGSVNSWAEAIYNDSTLCLAAEFEKNMGSWFEEQISPEEKRISAEIKLAYKDYMKGRMLFEKDRQFYPDANLTLRVAYGHVEGYSPADGILYKPVTTLDGILEKDNPDIFDYNVPQSLRDLHASGMYGKQPVCFLATNHTTGGNSGSPVINAEGNLIGLNFDRVWEGTMSDIAFDPDFCRNICLDINYLIFVVDKICGAGKILEECEFVCSNITL